MSLNVGVIGAGAMGTAISQCIAPILINCYCMPEEKKSVMI